MSNKVKFGIKSLHYAIGTPAADGSYTYGTPKPIKGSVNMSLEAQGESTPFYADDVVYYTSNSNSGYQGDIELALVPKDFRIDVLGEKEDVNGIVYEDANAPVVHFALLLEFDGDVEATRYALYDCTASRPAVASATKTDTTEPQTESITVTARPAYVAAVDAYVSKAYCDDKTATQYTGWYENVYTPTP